MAYPRFAPPAKPAVATHASRPDRRPNGLRQATA